MPAFLTKLLDWIFPRPYPVAEIERFSLTELRSAARPPAKMRLPALENVSVAATAIFHYRQPIIQQAVWELKYRGNPKIAQLFAQAAAAKLEEIRGQSPKEIVVIPLPSSAARRRERGWNQTEIIAARIPATIPRLTIRTDILRKIRHTTPQARLKNRQRLTNLTNSFALAKNFRPQLPLDSLIVLFDDVTTTGATFAEALKPFFQTGITDIYCLAIAH